MSITRGLVLVASVALLGASTAPAQMPEQPKPGPEHAILAKDAGT